jgi:hypothetical protein
VRTIVFVQPSSASLNKGSPRFGARLILNGNMSNAYFTFNMMEVSQMKNVFELYLDHPPISIDGLNFTFLIELFEHWYSPILLETYI